eukprot:12422532-Karenia_brevis.AAC.1
MDAEDQGLDNALLKIKLLFESDLQMAADTGRTGQGLWALGKCIKMFLKGDAVENEQFNSLISSMCNRCRNLTLPLLSSRVCLKKRLGVGGCNSSSRWSNVRDAASY